MASLALITARGGSRRIKDKNIRPFLGKPILCYSIEAALSSGLFSEVMVSTDSEKIAEIAEKAGAKVPFFRSKETAGDFATTADVCLEVIDAYRKQGQEFDSFCCIYPTAPFVDAAVLREAAEKLSDPSVSAVVPVVRFSFPPQRAFEINDRGFLSYRHPECASMRSQDLTPLYHDAGQFYFLKTAAFLTAKSMVPVGTQPLEREESLVQDIDNEEDWKIAEVKYRVRHPEA